MGWLDYYYLIRRYGSVDNAPQEEQAQAAKWNPNNPGSARSFAEHIWKKEPKEEA